MWKIKYYLFLKNTIHNFLWGSVKFLRLLLELSLNCMNIKETKKTSAPEIKKELKKSKLDVLTNENDFLVKNLKKAG